MSTENKTPPEQAHPAEAIVDAMEQGDCVDDYLRADRIKTWRTRLDAWLAQETAKARDAALEQAAKICHANCSWTSEREIRTLKVNP